jgi:hypothetical protein
VSGFFKKKEKIIEIAGPYTKIRQATAATVQMHDIVAYNLQKKWLGFLKWLRVIYDVK